MPHNGHSPDAVKAAVSRRPLILPGFDREKLLAIEFDTLAFGAKWLPRTYTREQHPEFRAQTDDVKQLARFGNNIWLLFKACSKLGYAWASPDFWPAIARGFSATPEHVEDMVSIFVDARHAYLDLSHSGAHVGTHTTRMVDNWIKFRHIFTYTTPRMLNQECDSAYEDMSIFFKDLEGQLLDCGGVFGKEAHQSYYPSYSRKRSASPEPLGPPRSPKRRQSSTYDQPDTQPFRPQRPLTHRPAGLQIRGSATRQECQRPIRASEQHASDSRSSHDPSDPSDLWEKVHGSAHKGTNGTSRVSSDKSIGEDGRPVQQRLSLTDHQLAQIASLLSSGLSAEWMAKMTNLEKQVVTKLEKQVATKLEKQVATKLEKQVATTLEKQVAAEASLASASAAMQQQITSLVQEVKSVKEDNALLKEKLATAEKLALGHAESTRDVQQRLRSVELNMLTDKEGTQAESASLGSRVTALECEKHSQGSVSTNKDVERGVNDLAGDLAKVLNTVQENQIAQREVMQCTQRLGDRITKIETGPDENNRLHEMEGKVAKLEGKLADSESRVDKLERQAKINEKHENEKEEYASKAFIEEKLKHAEHRHARDIEATAKHKHVQRLQEQVKSLQDQFANKDVEVSRLSKTVDTLSTPKSPSPAEGSLWSIDDMAKKVDTYTKSKSDKIFQLERTIRDEMGEERKNTVAKIEMLQRAGEEAVEKNGNVPSMGSINANISDRFSMIDKSLRSDVGIAQRDMTARIDKFYTDLETLTSQFKGLNKMWNKAMADVTKAGSVVADMDVTKGDMLRLSKKLDKFANGVVDASMKELGTRLDKLEAWICELSVNVKSGTSPGIRPADLLARIEELQGQIDDISPATGSLGDVPKLKDKIDGVAQIVQKLVLALAN